MKLIKRFTDYLITQIKPYFFVMELILHNRSFNEPDFTKFKVNNKKVDVFVVSNQKNKELFI